jgi:Mrp family chromosome partitioning ATPase
MGLKGQSGLADLLSSDQPLADAVAANVRQLAVGLDFVPAGGRRLNPGELLSSSRFAELLAWAEAHYDQVLIDSPPVLAAPDAAIVGRLVDGVMLVLQPKKNRRRLVMRAAESFVALGVNLLGVVVNRIGDDKADAIYGYGADAGYGYGYGHDEPQTATATAGEAAPGGTNKPGANKPGGGAKKSGVQPRRVA